jgi:hypothetical protein
MEGLKTRISCQCPLYRCSNASRNQDNGFIIVKLSKNLIAHYYRRSLFISFYNKLVCIFERIKKILNSINFGQNQTKSTTCLFILSKNLLLLVDADQNILGLNIPAQ